MTDSLADRVASVPVRCPRCGANLWHVFDGDPVGDDAGHVFVRLVCATPRHGPVTLVRRMFPDGRHAA